MKIRVFLCAMMVGALAMADELLSETVKTYEWMGKPGYSVNMVAPEISQLLSQVLSAQMQKATGLPMAIKIRNFHLTSAIDGVNVKVGLDIPDEQLRTQMEANLNQMLATSGFSKVMADSTIGAILKITEFAKAHADSFTPTPEGNEQFAQYSCTNPSFSAFGSSSVSKILINVNKQYKIIPAIRFDFADGTAILIQFAHDMVQGRACPLRMRAQHTMKQAPGGMRIPPILTAILSDYKFK